jgi:outer membrane protein assembly factor BamB
VWIAAQTAEALEAAADRQIVHCDIKPENIMLLADDEVKVLDFGIASLADSQFRQIAGTPAYMAPELWRGETPVPATDIYALGCMLYEALTGCQPFNSDDDASLSHVHQTLEPDWRLFTSEAAPGELLGLLQRMLAKPTAARPTASEAAAELRHLGETLPPDLTLSGGGALPVQAVEESDETRLRPDLDTEDQTRIDDGTRVQPAERPTTPDHFSTPSAPEFDSLGTGEQVFVQRHLTRIDMTAEACRAALVHDNALFTASLDGQVYRLDLQTGRVARWPVFTPQKVRSPAWGLTAANGHLFVHAGDTEWVQLDCQSGQVLRQGTLPEPGMAWAVSGGWLYLFGSRGVVYRVATQNPKQRDEFQLGARLTGQPYLGRGAIFAPTAGGLKRLDTGSGQVSLHGPSQTVRSITALPGERLAVVYSVVDSNDVQQTFVRVFSLAGGEATVEAGVEMTGQPAGPVLATASAPDESGGRSLRLFLACRDGQVRAWDLENKGRFWELKPRWGQTVGAGRGLQSNAALSGGLMALAPGKDNAGLLVVLNTSTGETVFDQPLDGEVFIAPMWWQRTLSLILAGGAIEVFRITLLADEHA